MTKNFLSKPLLLFLFMVPALALGSGGYFYITEGADDYEKGKKIFHETVVCKQCPYPELELNSEEVSNIMPSLGHNGMIGKHLNLNERRALKVYLNRRFSI
jgi:hypothetical protein